MAAYDLGNAMTSGDVGELVDFHQSPMESAVSVTALFQDLIYDRRDGGVVQDAGRCWVLMADLADGGTPITPARLATVSREDGAVWTVDSVMPQGLVWRMELRRNRRPKL